MIRLCFYSSHGAQKHDEEMYIDLYDIHRTK